MHCLVTGASGFLGVHLCRRLLQEEGVYVRAIGRRRELPFHHPRLEYQACELAAVPARASELFAGIDTVFHLAGIAHNKAADDELWQVNALQSCALMDAALKAGVGGFIYVSSSKAQQEPGDSIGSENAAPADASDPYGYSKWHAEQHLLSLEGFTHRVIARPCLVYGAGVQGNLASLIRVARRGLLPAMPDTGARRSMVAADDVAEALWLMATCPQANGEVYLLSDDEHYSAHDLVESIYQALGKKPPFSMPVILLRLFAVIGEVPLRLVGKSPFTLSAYRKLLGPALYSSEKIRQQLGWQPRYRFDLLLPEIISAGEKANAEGGSV